MPLVKPGQLVTINLRKGTVELRSVARAMEEGSLGQTIRVRNENTRDVLDVTVTGAAGGAASATTAESRTIERIARCRIRSANFCRFAAAWRDFMRLADACAKCSAVGGSIRIHHVSGGRRAIARLMPIRRRSFPSACWSSGPADRFCALKPWARPMAPPLTPGSASYYDVPEPKPKLLRKHDLVTIVIRENSQFTTNGTTDLKHANDLDAIIDSYVMLGMQGGGPTLDEHAPRTPIEMKTSGQRDFKGDVDTSNATTHSPAASPPKWSTSSPTAP